MFGNKPSLLLHNLISFWLCLYCWQLHSLNWWDWVDQLQSLNSCEWGDSAREDRALPKLEQTQQPPAVGWCPTMTQLLVPSFNGTRSESLQCGLKPEDLKKVMTFVVWQFLTRIDISLKQISVVFSIILDEDNVYSFSQVFSYIF